MKYSRIYDPKVDRAIKAFNDGKINEVQLCSIIYRCHPLKWAHVVSWARKSLTERGWRDVTKVTEEDIYDYLSEKCGDAYLSRLKKSLTGININLPYRLCIHASIIKDVCTVDEDDPHLAPGDFIYYFEPRRVEEEIYNKYCDTWQEALAKWEEKYFQYVEEILTSGYTNDGYPVYTVTMEITRGEKILKSKQFKVD